MKKKRQSEKYRFAMAFLFKQMVEEEKERLECQWRGGQRKIVKAGMK